VNDRIARASALRNGGGHDCAHRAATFGKTTLPSLLVSGLERSRIKRSVQIDETALYSSYHARRPWCSNSLARCVGRSE
jgi:hypothetical protein